MTDLEKAARMAQEALEAHADIGIKADKAITALRQALSNSVERPAKERHIAYVCPQCQWTLEEQPAQQEPKKFDPNESFAREEAAQARVREFMRNH